MSTVSGVAAVSYDLVPKRPTSPLTANQGDRDGYDDDAYRKAAAEKAEKYKALELKNQERAKKGLKPLKMHQDVPEPTSTAQIRSTPLDLEQNLGKTILIENSSGRGPGQPGFYCERCRWTLKDTAGYLDHINSRMHLRKMGQSTKVERSTVEQVRDRIAELIEMTKAKSEAKEYDFQMRVNEIKAEQDAVKSQKRMAAKEAKAEAKRQKLEQKNGDDESKESKAMMEAMGFKGFGSTKA